MGSVGNTQAAALQTPALLLHSLPPCPNTLLHHQERQKKAPRSYWGMDELSREQGLPGEWGPRAGRDGWHLRQKGTAHPHPTLASVCQWKERGLIPGHPSPVSIARSPGGWAVQAVRG